MNLNFLKEIYDNSPLFIKRIYSKMPIGVRHSRDYKACISILNTPPIDIEKFQFEKLKSTLIFAYENTQYYEELFNEIQFNPYKFRNIEEFSVVPVLSKDIVKKNFDKLLIKSFDKSKNFYVTTGGTTGQQSKFWQSNNVWKKEMAYVHYYWGKYNYTHKQLKASFRGGEFPNSYWKYNPIQNEIHFSPFHINTETIDVYVNKLNDLKPLFFHGYPSSILSLIDNMNLKSKKLDYHLSCIFLVSENYTKDQIKKIKDFFKCDIFTFYGHSERLVFAPSIDKDLTLYKPDSFYGFFELVDNKNETITANNISGEIIGTSFDNYAMPLIRYKTGDKTSFADIDNNIINCIEGRWKQEYLEGINGQKITLTALNLHSDVLKNVLNYQFYQKKAGDAVLFIKINSSFSEFDKKKILVALNRKAGHVINFSIKIVDEFKLTERGKFKLLINKIK